MKTKVYEVWVGDMFYGSFQTKTQAVQYARKLYEADHTIMALIKEGRV